MKDITQGLEAAKFIIKNQLGSHQATPEQAVYYAMSQLDLPNDVTLQLVEFARLTAKYI